MNNKIISFKKRKEKLCQHLNIIVDRDCNNIFCEACGTELNPIEFLYLLAQEQETIEYQIFRLKKIKIKLEEFLKNRKRTKCEHCGKMTHINL